LQPEILIFLVMKNREIVSSIQQKSQSRFGRILIQPAQGKKEKKTEKKKYYQKSKYHPTKLRFPRTKI